MKILVDKLPKDLHECPEHKIVSDPSKIAGENWINGCEKSNSRSFECRQGIDENFVCPYYREFDGVARRYITNDSGVTTGEIRIPISLN